MTVIRKAIIEIETRQKKSRLEAPDVGSAERAYKAETEAAEKASQSSDKATESFKRHSETVRTSSVSMVRDFREAGEGVLRFTRGLALLSAGGSDDLKKLVQQVAIAQAAFDVFAGGFKALQNISRLFGPVGVAITAVTGALALAITTWRSWGKSATESATEAAEKLKKLQEQIQKVIDARERLAGVERSITERDRAFRRERIELLPEAERPAARRAEAARLQRELEEAEQRSRIASEFAALQPGMLVGGTVVSQQAVDRAMREAALAGREAGNLARDQIEVQKQLVEEDRKRFDLERNTARFAAGAFSGVGGIAAAPLAGLFAQQVGLDIDRREREFEERFRSLFDKLFKIIQDNDNRFNELRDAVRGASSR